LPEEPSDPYVAEPDDGDGVPRPTRRMVLLGGLGAAVAAATYSIWSDTFGSALSRRPTAPVPDSAVTGISLPVLPSDEGTLEDGVRTFRLNLTAGKSNFIAGHESETWGINRDYLGPVLQVNNGERIHMHVENGLDEPTTLHWHGVHLPAVMDGGVFQPIEPGGTWDPEWEIRQSAATLWFHPHLYGKTREHVLRGLAGVLAIHDPTEDGLPNRPGEDDFAVILQENTLNDQGGLDTSDGTRVTLVNGAIAPKLRLPDGPARLRVLNASDTRAFQLAFDDFRSLTIVGVDGGRLNNPVTVDDVKIGPAERVELLVDHAGARLVALDPDAGQPGASNVAVGDAPAEVLLELEGGPTGTVSQKPPPSAPSPAELPDPAAATVNRHLVLQAVGPGLGIGVDPPLQIDDTAAGISTVCTLPPQAGSAPPAEELPSFTTTVDTTEVWAVENTTDVVHFFHVHDVQFKVVDRDGSPPLEHELGRKDTVRVEPGSTVRIALALKDYTDPSCPYMFHCHMLTHEDQGMMGHFTVVDAGAA
jgi:FtsP/CotA-like multicopper oxidase with cupredoxin domain